MTATKAEAIQYLKATIAAYRSQLEGLQRRVADPSAKVTELARINMQRDQLTGLIDDASKLLSQLGANAA